MMRVIYLLLLCLATWLNFHSCALAQSAVNDSMVTHSQRGRDVLQIQTQFDRSSMATTGLAHVSVVARRPSPVDRDLVVVLYVKAYAVASGEAFAYRHPVRLDEGETTVKIEIPHLRYDSHTVWDVGIFEDGEDIEEKPPNWGNTPNWLYFDTQQLPILGLRSESEDEAALSAGMLAQTKLVDPQFDPNSRSSLTGVLQQFAHVQSVLEASEDWRSYYAYNYVALTPSAIEAINQQAAVAGAVRQAVLAGGSLLIHGVEDPEDWQAIDQLLALPNASGDLTQLESPDPAAGWYRDPLVNRIAAASLSETQPKPLTTDRPQGLTEYQALYRSVGFGHLMVSSLPLGKIPVQKFSFGVASRIAAMSPTGQATDGNWFWRNLIRAVGKPPVWMFCAMVTLFGAVLGPGLLWITGRIKRRSLMIFLVPAISLVATGAIIVYSILSEGFQTHVRVTSVQFVDGSNGDGFAWSRQNYFSGLPPREGLNFSLQTYARPVYPETNKNSWGMNSDPRRSLSGTITLTNEQQNWSGWLRPRQQQQLLVGHSLKRTQLPISIKRLSDNSVQVANQTNAPLPIILLRGAQDDYYLTRDLGAGQQVDITAEDATRVAPRISLTLVDYRPEAPPELGEGGSLLNFGNNSGSYTNNTPGAEMEDVLNLAFKRWLSDKFQLPPFGLAVLASHSQAIEVPLQGNSNENLHLTVGAQAW